MATAKDAPRKEYRTAFAHALRETLEWARAQNDDTWRSLADRLGKPESLISLYRNGDRYPGVAALLCYEETFPGFMGRLATLFNRYLRDMQ
jgi:ABC-type nitrate/sulfonate/bicarbonate transport system substrate-binding protein